MQPSNRFTSRVAASVLRLLLLGLLPSACSASDALPQIISGVYEGMLIATDKAGVVTGYFNREQGNASCEFFLKSQGRGPTFKVVTWSDAEAPAYTGTLQSQGAEDVVLNVKQVGDHPGCGNVLGGDTSEGLPFSRTLQAPWSSLKQVQSERAYFHSEPSKDTKRKAYVVKGNVLAVLSNKGEWIEVEFYNANNPKKTTKGWVQLGDLADLKPPK